MPGMKRDCGGAAGILGAFYTAVKLVCTNRFYGGERGDFSLPAQVPKSGFKIKIFSKVYVSTHD